MKNPIGQWVSAWDKKGHIIAVLKDFHTQSLREPIKPVIIDVKEYENFGVIIVRAKPGKTKEALASMASAYKDINPAYPFAYQFVDEEYKKLYNNEEIVSGLTILFATLAILISCLGLLGLVMFAAEQRVREISVKESAGCFIRANCYAFLTGFFEVDYDSLFNSGPIGLVRHASVVTGFRLQVVGISWWVFVMAGAVSVIIALVTISYQAVKAAIANPVKGLRAD